MLSSSPSYPVGQTGSLASQTWPAKANLLSVGPTSASPISPRTLSVRVRGAQQPSVAPIWPPRRRLRRRPPLPAPSSVVASSQLKPRKDGAGDGFASPCPPRSALSAAQASWWCFLELLWGWFFRAAGLPELDPAEESLEAARRQGSWSLWFFMLWLFWSPRSIIYQFETFGMGNCLFSTLAAIDFL